MSKFTATALISTSIEDVEEAKRELKKHAALLKSLLGITVTAKIEVQDGPNEQGTEFLVEGPKDVQ